MCIAIYKPRSVEIPKETLAQCFSSNPDGAGFMFAEKGRLNIQKGFFSFNEFWEAYEKHQDKHAAIHFRIKTHGKIDEVNCHPFRINTTLGFIHNGTISGHGTTEHSDTYMFNEEVIKPMMKRFGKNAIYDDTIKTLIEKYIGWSKLVFLDNYGDYQIFNEASGNWHNGAWYSNHSYRPPAPPKPVEKTPPIIHSYKQGGYEYYPRGREKSLKPEWFVSKRTGHDIWKGDWVMVNWTYRGLEKGTVAYVDYVHSTGVCDITATDGSILTGFPGGYLDYYDWEKELADDIIL